MKFKKFLALSLAAAMMTTGIPGVGMLDGAVNVMAANVTGAAVTLDAVGDVTSKVSIDNIGYDDTVITKCGDAFVYYGSSGDVDTAVLNKFDVSKISGTGLAVSTSIQNATNTYSTGTALNDGETYKLVVTVKNTSTSDSDSISIPVTFVVATINNANGKFTSSDGTT